MGEKKSESKKNDIMFKTKSWNFMRLGISFFFPHFRRDKCRQTDCVVFVESQKSGRHRNCNCRIVICRKLHEAASQVSPDRTYIFQYENRKRFQVEGTMAKMPTEY